MAAQPHGSEFLLRRLQRATAIPPAERPPDAAAFVTSAQLLREACDLLPLTSDGKPTLQLGSADVRQQATLALLKWAHADYICPAVPVSDRDASFHVVEWCKKLVNVQCGLPVLLVQYIFLRHNRWYSMEEVSDIAAAMLDLLASSPGRQVISGQLAQLAAAYPGHPLLSYNQLHYACCCAIVQAVDHTWSAGAVAEAQHLAAGTQHSASAALHGVPAVAAFAAARASATLSDLEPQNPKSCVMAAAAERSGVAETSRVTAQVMLRVARLNAQGAQLAKQQGHMYFTAFCAAEAVQALSTVAQDHPDSWQAAVAAFEGAEAAVHACKRLLPSEWVDSLKVAVRLAKQSIPIAQRQLQLQQQSRARAAPTYYAELVDIAGSAINDRQRLGMCDGCGQKAVGLRRCARCKLAQYCSTECQHKHWRTHKRECRQA